MFILEVVLPKLLRRNMCNAHDMCREADCQTLEVDREKGQETPEQKESAGRKNSGDSRPDRADLSGGKRGRIQAYGHEANLEYVLCSRRL